MANYSRSKIVFDGDLFHVTWQCHNHSWLLSSESAKKLYYNLLLKYKDHYGVAFYSYCLMDTHPHLTGKCATQKQMSDFFRVVNSCFAKKINKTLKRKGQVCMDRFKSPTMDNQDDLLNVIIYNDLNPSRTVNGTHPKDFKWSSYCHYAYGKKDSLLTEPGCYTRMGRTPRERQESYRKMIQEIFATDARVFKKCPYRNDKGRMILFLGDPVKVQMKYDELKKVFRQKRRQWLERFRRIKERRSRAA